ncbi:hypothetical protein BDN71DRAFT_1485080 [Pleurotus eryngii]|uniref:Amidohydrolase-related domain-containing protein n=1 Tax=Pleurotus eryngii TaxID=5323 RepID=A0A9P5ZKX3_PLEER|nr:hypothetical protein BDN71DRAFT_1485080 [Pleurotus eryngii]
MTSLQPADAPVPGIKTPARSQLDRYGPSKDEQLNKRKKYVKLKNGEVWTGRLNGTEVMQGDMVFGASDGNSRNGPILPVLRSIDRLNTHDESHILVMAGGVTTAQALPGSALFLGLDGSNRQITGGQSFRIKLRPTNERSVISKVVEPPYTLLNGSRYGEGDWDFEARPRWRHVKHACGENPDRRYGFTSMDAAWVYRNAYNEAKNIKDQQDEFCSQLLNGELRRAEEEFPESPLETEALVDVLRGRVKLSIHCYEGSFGLNLSNEFKFLIAFLHHTSETYLVPELLRRTWVLYYYLPLYYDNVLTKKREAYRDSEFAPKVLADYGIPVVMKSDHPVLNNRYLLYEAQQAHFYGLNPTKAFESVTMTPAKAAGLGHRLGYVSEDIVVWDFHPLTLGATPQRVPPKTPDFEKEAREAVENDGLPPFEASIIIRGKLVVLKNLSTGYIRDGDGVNPEDFEEIDLEGGVILPGLTTFGSSIGLTEIAREPTTNDGNAVEPFSAIPPLLGGPLETFVHAEDGLQFGGRNTLLACRGGITQAIVAPVGSRFGFGSATAFSTAASNALRQGAVIQNTTALHMSITHQNDISVSTQIAALRRCLLQSTGERQSTDAVVVIHVDSADIMATLIKLKREYHETTEQNVRFTFAGGTEAHLLADDIAKENISVIFTPSRPFPVDWDKRRILPGPPLTSDTQISYLLRKGMNVGLGTVDDFDARNARFDAEWAQVSSGGYRQSKAIELVTVNLERALSVTESNSDMVVLKGGSIGFKGKLFSVTSKRRGVVEILL